MGWTGSYEWRNRADVAREVTAPFGAPGETQHETLRQCWRGTNLWTVHQTTAPDGEVARFVVLYMVQKGRDGEYCYKDISEECGPMDVNCPLAYLELCTEAEGRYAKAWRFKVRDFHKRATRRRSYIRSLQAGDEVTLTNCGIDSVTFYGRRYRGGIYGGGYKIKAALVKVPEDYQLHDLRIGGAEGGSNDE